MRGYVHTNVQQASDRQHWFDQQVKTARQRLKAGKPASVSSAKVNEWLDSWGTGTELPAPAPRPVRKAKSVAALARLMGEVRCSGDEIADSLALR